MEETENMQGEEIKEETATEEMQNEEVINEAVPETEAQKEAADSEEAQSEEPENEEPDRKKGRDPELEAAIEAVLFATGNSVKMSRLAEVLERTEEEIREAAERMKKSYAKAGRGLILTELEDALQLGTKGEYYEYLIKLAKTPRRMTLSDTAIETLSIIAYKQPVTKAEIERIRGVSCEHAINRLLEYELIEEVGRLDAPGRPLLFGTTEQFLRSFGVRSLGELPVMSPELMQDFKEQAEAEAEEDLNVKVDV